ncbi:hypothetical protein TKK_0007465 [Trichogramma kaykai]
MKLYCLSTEPTKPCLVVTFKGITLMLDCGLNMQSVLNFMPLPLVHSAKFDALPYWTPRDESKDWQIDRELKSHAAANRLFVDSAPEFCPPVEKIIDFSQIDVILISNYTCMLALPFITEGTGFKGVIYATEPTLQIGRFFMEELVEFIERSPKEIVAKHWKEMIHVLPPPLADCIKPKSWKHIYSKAAMNAALSHIQLVGYDQKLDVYGALSVTAISSGYCLGSSNWIIASDHEKIAYVSGSSTLTTHPKPMEQNMLKHANAIILTGLAPLPNQNPDTMLGEFCMTIATTLRQGGCVLIPSYPSGVIYDLFECLSIHLDKTGLSQVPLFFISPVAETSLAYSNIFAEWLSSGKQNKVYLPEEPFPHAFLVKNGKLKHYTSTHAEGFSTEYRQPCVVFCGHPSLRFGDAVHFMQLWSNNPLNTVIFTEPDFVIEQLLAPYLPMAMKALHYPIDTSLNFSQANKLIRDLKPDHLVVPERYTLAPLTVPHRNDLVIEPIGDKPLITFNRGEVIKLPIRRQKTRVLLEPALAETIKPVEIRPGVSMATVTAELEVKDNTYTMKYLESRNGRKRKTQGLPPCKEDVLRGRRIEFGSINPELLIQKLNQEGITGAKLQRTPQSAVILLQDSNAKIELQDNSTLICCNGDLKIRRRLRMCVLQCLKRI